MLSIYPAYFLKESDGYTVLFPDWDGTVTCGDTFENAMSMAIDCLAGLVFSCNLEGKKVPKASDLSDLDIKRKAKEEGLSQDQVIANMVSVDVEEYARIHFTKAVKKTVTILEWQNAEGVKRGINFSKVFQDALTEKLTESTL